MLHKLPLQSDMYVFVLFQDTERWLPSESVPYYVLRWDSVFWRWNARSEYLQDGRSQVPLWHSGMQPNDWFCGTLQWVSSQKCDRYVFFKGSHTLTFPVSPSTEDEMRFFAFSNASRATQFSREVMKTQGEWEFLQLSISTSNLKYQNKDWELLIYTVCNTQTNQRQKV